MSEVVGGGRRGRKGKADAEVAGSVSRGREEESVAEVAVESRGDGEKGRGGDGEREEGDDDGEEEGEDNDKGAEYGGAAQTGGVEE